MAEHPIVLHITDDLHRSRLTVFFRLILAIPHFIWVAIWTIGAAVVAIIAWLIALFTGRLPGSLHRFFLAYVNYVAHLTAYLALAANPYPPFDGRRGRYPIDVELPADPERQSRWRILFRLVLAIPSILLATAFYGFTGTQTSAGSSSGREGGGVAFGGPLFAVAILGWFASLATGRMPRGFRDAAGYGIGYRAQTFAYLLLVTDRYPNADPRPLLHSVERPPVHDVHVAADDDDLRRSRVTVLFRLPLAIPHLVWLVLWSVLALLASILQWFVTLVRGRPATALHRFISSWIRYGVHVSAFLSVASNPFPGFTGTPGTYPLDVALPPPGRQNRWKTAFRAILAFPTFIVSSALGSAWLIAAVLTWFTGLFLGRAPEGLHRLLVYVIRYDAQLYAYLFFVTDRYPHSSPLEGAEPPAEPESFRPPEDELPLFPAPA